MNISSQYTWQKVGGRRNNPLLPQNIQGLVIGKSGCEKTTVIFNMLLQPGWLDYNHLYVFGKSQHQPEYKVLREGFEGGLTKSQISNMFMHQIPPEDLSSTVGLEVVPSKLIFTMIAALYQTQQILNLHKRTCCCWMTVS